MSRSREGFVRGERKMRDNLLRDSRPAWFSRAATKQLRLDPNDHNNVRKTWNSEFLPSPDMAFLKPVTWVSTAFNNNSFFSDFCARKYVLRVVFTRVGEIKPSKLNSKKETCTCLQIMTNSHADREFSKCIRIIMQFDEKVTYRRGRVQHCPDKCTGIHCAGPYSFSPTLSVKNKAKGSCVRFWSQREKNTTTKKTVTLAIRSLWQ